MYRLVSRTHHRYINIRSSALHCPPRPVVLVPLRKRTTATCTGSAQTAVSSSLISVLKDELKYERENYRKDETLLVEPPPNGFEIENTAGRKAFYLLKAHKNEVISIEVDLDAQPGADDEDFDDEESEEGVVDDDPPVKFMVTISKDSSLLKFECESDGDYVAINHIAHESHAPEDDDIEDGEGGDTKDAYTGPVFDELDDTLQQAFLDYLEERGVTGELGGYLKLLCIDKEAQEYQAWLGRVKDFVME